MAMKHRAGVNTRTGVRRITHGSRSFTSVSTSFHHQRHSSPCSLHLANVAVIHKLGSSSRALALSPSSHAVTCPQLPHKRWLGTKYLAKVAMMNEAWAQKAREAEEGKRQHFWDFLRERGLIKDVAGNEEDIKKLFTIQRIGGYCGIDPTAPSLHVGHLVACMPIFHMYIRGYPAFTLLGAATSKIGDPIGRATARVPQHGDEFRNNLFKLQFQLKQLWGNVENINRRTNGWEREWHHRRGIENNGVWWNKQPLFEVLRYLGNDVRMGPLLSRETAKMRLAEGGQGMSVNEFLYPIIQAWDWWLLYNRLNIQVQVGGSDQYGNIVTGIEIFKSIRKNEPDPAKRIQPGLLSDPIGFTTPLLTTSSGEKLGKSAGNAIWLDPFMNPSADLYAYFLRQSDEKAKELMYLITFVPTKDIEKLWEEHMKDPPKRILHHRLAFETVWLCHGFDAAKTAQSRHVTLHGGDIKVLEKAKAAPEGSVSLNSRPKMDMQLPFSVLKLPISRVLVAAGLAETASEGYRLASQQAVYLGGAPGKNPGDGRSIPEYQVHFTPVKQWFSEQNENFLIDDKYLYLRKGKHNMRIIELIPEEEWVASGKTYPGEVKPGELRTLREELKKAETVLKAGENPQEVDKAIDDVRKSHWRAGLAKGTENSAIQFPADNARTTRLQEAHAPAISMIRKAKFPNKKTSSQPDFTQEPFDLNSFADANSTAGAAPGFTGSNKVRGITPRSLDEMDFANQDSRDDFLTPAPNVPQDEMDELALALRKSGNSAGKGFTKSKGKREDGGQKAKWLQRGSSRKWNS